MEIKRIIHVLKGKANPDTMNGVNKVVHNLATTQFAQGYEVEVWGITATPDNVRHTHDYPLHLFKATRNRFAIRKEMLQTLDRVKLGTIFHLHSVFLPEMYSLSRHLKRRGIKWVVTPHGGYGPEALKKNALAKKVYKKLFEDRLIAEAAAIHSIGIYGEADQFDEATQKTKVGVVPNGQLLSKIHKTTYSIEGPLHLCYCGRLAVAHKGLDLLLGALRLAVEEGVDLCFDVIGDGPDRLALHSICQSLGLNKRVTFHGVRMGAEKEELIMRADLFVHTSRWDGMPTAVLEAAAMGLPLLVTLPTNVGHYVTTASAGFVVDELRPECIARAIVSAAAAKHAGQLMAKGLAARQMIIDKFSWPLVATALYEAVYSKATY